MGTVLCETLIVISSILLSKPVLIFQICFDQELVEADPATSLWRFCTLLPFSLKEFIRNATVHPNPPRTEA